MKPTLNRDHIHTALAALEACAEAWGIELDECQDGGPRAPGTEPRLMAYTLAFERLKSGPAVAKLFNKHHDSIYSGMHTMRDLVDTCPKTKKKAEEARLIFERLAA